MNRRTGVVAIALCLATLQAHGASHQDKPSIANSAASEAEGQPAPQSPRLERIGTRASPLVVETVENVRDAIDKERAAKIRQLESSTNKWAVILTGGLLAVAVIQACFFMVQLRLMRRSMKVAESAVAATETSVEIMRDTARRQLRAYVSVDRAWIEFPEPGVPSVTVVVKNAGQTPAHHVRHWIHQWIETYPLNIDLPTPSEELEISASPLGAGATHHMRIRHPKPIIELPYVDQIGTPQATIYVYGEIHYKDVFGEDHYLKYRLMHGGQNKPTAGVLAPCAEGNETT